jgi:tight adherence protein B
MMAWGFGSDPTTLPHRLWSKYVVFLNGWLRQLFLPPTGARIAACQAALLFLAVLGGLLGLPFWYAAAAVIVLAPILYLKKRRNERLVKIEAQVVPFTMGLANALKSTANIGTALEVLEPMLAPPLQQDLGLALKEIRVGSPVDQSLHAMAARSRSPELEATLAAVLIGRHVGGNLPEILDTTSRTLREITRLAGAVRAKTASGRSQLWVLGAAPGVVLVLFEMVKPGYFNPLTSSTIGWIVSMVIALLWVVGVILARKVMQVDV